jgi:hypothetical protein
MRNAISRAAGATACLSLFLIFEAPVVQAATVFQENFSGATPGTYGGAIAGTNFAVTGGNIDIVGVLNGSFFTCVGNAGGNCLDLIGNLGSGQITSTAGIDVIAGHTYTISYTSVLQGFPTGATPTESYTVALGSTAFNETVVPIVTSNSFSFLAGATELGALLVFTSGTNLDNIHGPVLSDIAVTDTVSQTPLPGALPLFASGLGLMALLRRRKKRQTVEVLA